MVSQPKQNDERVAILVGLKRINDLDLIETSQVYRETGFKDDDRDRVRRIADIIGLLYDDFDYMQSPEFCRTTQGKSAAFVAMKKKLFTPVKQKEARFRFSRGLERMPDTIADLRVLLPQDKHSLLDELAALIRGLS